MENILDPTNTALSVQDANQLVLDKINEAEEQMIFGFLPLKLCEQKTVIEAVKTALRQDCVRITGLLRATPAATGYALATAPSQYLTTGGIYWEPLERSLDSRIPNTQRTELPHLFRTICRNLGLLSGTLEQAGWTNIAPFIYQAGILPTWIDSLTHALQTTLRSRPAPDLEDPAALRAFADAIRARIHGQANLGHLLESEVGPLLIRRIVTAYQQNDWELLPAHLKKKIYEAFISGRAVSLRSPYLCFDPAFQSLQLVLPAVSSSITTPSSRWRIENREHAAWKETRIPLEELQQRNCSIELAELAAPYESLTFSVDARFNSDRPFRVFRSDNGRERTFSLNSNILLPPNSYTVVMSKNVATNDEDFVEENENFRQLDIDLRPGDDPLVLSTADERWTLQPRLKSGFYINHAVASTTILENGDLLHYGDELGSVGYLPTHGLNENSHIEFSIECEERDLAKSAEIEIPDCLQRGVYLFKSERQELHTREFLSHLPSGIHRVKATLATHLERAEYVFWFWKGLRFISHHHGYQCDTWPENLNMTQSTGIRRINNNIGIQENYHGPSITLRLTTPDIELTLPRAGARAVIVDPENNFEEIAEPTEPIVVTANDPRTIRFESGGFTDWEIAAPNRQIITLNKQRTRYATSLNGLASEIAGSSTILAKSIDSEIHLLTLTKPLTATIPTRHPAPPELPQKWSFSVALQPNDIIGVSVTDLSDSPRLTPSSISALVDWDDGKEISFEEIRIGAAAIVISATSEGESDAGFFNIDVKIFYDPEHLEGEFWSIEFYHRSDPYSDWVPLSCAEPHGHYSTLGLFVSGKNRPTGDSSWWKHLRAASLSDLNDDEPTETKQILSAISDENLQDALKACRQLLNRKYPSTVWDDHAKHIRYIPIHLGENRYNVFDNSGPIWWHEATLDLAKYAAATSPPILHQFLFAAQSGALRLPRDKTVLSSPYHRDIITASLAVPAMIQEKGSLRNWLLPGMDKNHLSETVLQSFGNLSEAARNESIDLKNFCLNHFLKARNQGLYRETERLIDRQIQVKWPQPLLSGEHLLLCIQKLNRRSRIIYMATQKDTPHPLARVAQPLTRARNNLSWTGPQVAQLIGWSNQNEESWWCPPGCENPLVESVAALAWTVAASARLAAHRETSAESFNRVLEELSNSPDGANSRTNITRLLSHLLSLAPELYAFYVALFELRFPHSRANNNQPN